MKGRGGLLFSPLVRARASLKFLLPPYKLQRGFAGRYRLRRPYFFPSCLIDLTKP